MDNLNLHESHGLTLFHRLGAVGAVTHKVYRTSGNGIKKSTAATKNYKPFIVLAGIF
jgi:hypothetical protein